VQYFLLTNSLQGGRRFCGNQWERAKKTASGSNLATAVDFPPKGHVTPFRLAESRRTSSSSRIGGPSNVIRKGRNELNVRKNYVTIVITSIQKLPPIGISGGREEPRKSGGKKKPP